MNWRALLAILRPAPKLFGCYAALSVISGALTPIAAWLLASMLGTLAAPAPHQPVLILAAGLAVVSALAGILGEVLRYLQAELGRVLSRQAKAELMDRLNRLTGLQLLEQPAFLNRLRLAQQGGAGAPQALVRALFGCIQACVSSAGFVLALASVRPWLAAVAALGCVPVAAAALSESRRRSRLIWQSSIGFRREMFYAALMSDARAAQEIRLFGMGGFLHRRMLAEITELDLGQQRIDRRVLWTQALLAGAAALLVGSATVWASLGAARGQLTVGQVGLVLSGLAGLQATTANLVRTATDGWAALDMFCHHLRVLSIADNGSVSGGRPVPALTGGIEFRAVSFGYPDGPMVLDRVSFSIPAGATLALVGLNGAGKSSVAKLLCRLYEPSDGVILWDGVDIATLDPVRLRARIAAVFQDFMQYDMSAAENIGIGALDCQDEPAGPAPVRAAAALAGIDGVLSGLPQGYQSMLGRHFGSGPAAEAGRPDLGPAGSQLSGGQWQRLALARALVRPDVDLLILDEPSAGLDAAAEAQLHQRLYSARRCASLLISHRLNVVRNAEQIVVLAGGRVTERGSHSELMSLDGEYARLFRLQANGYRSSSAVGS